MKVQIKTSDETLHHCFCELMSREILVKVKKVRFEDQIGIFSFTPDFSYVPTTQLICYYYNSDGLIASGSTSLSFRDQLSNYVRLSKWLRNYWVAIVTQFFFILKLDLKLSSSTVKPGTNMSLNVGSYLNSTVSLSCLDQAVLLLESGNDFQKDDVFSSLDSYNYLDNNFWWNYPEEAQPFGVSKCLTS